MFFVFSSSIDPNSDLARMKSMFEEALLSHPEHTLENPAEVFYKNFETFKPFWRAIGEREMTEKNYLNEYDFKKIDEKAHIFWYELAAVSEVIIGEIISKHEDTVYNEIYSKYCILGKEFIIRIDTVLMGDIFEGEIIKVRSRGGKLNPRTPYYEDYPYMSGDSVLVLLRHFPSMRCRDIRNKHINEIGYRMPFYEVKSMFWVTSLYITKDIPSGKVNTVTGPVHVKFHEKPYLWIKPFDYPYSEVIETLSKFIKCGKELQKRWYNCFNTQIMDSLILKQLDSESVTNSIIWR